MIKEIVVPLAGVSQVVYFSKYQNVSVTTPQTPFPKKQDDFGQKLQN